MTEQAGDGFVEYLLEQGRMNERDALALERARAAGWPDAPANVGVFDRDPNYLVGEEYVNPCAEIFIPEVRGTNRVGGQLVPPTADYVHSITYTPSLTPEGTRSHAGGTHQYFNSFRDWQEYMRTGEINMRRANWNNVVLRVRWAWYMVRHTVASQIFTLTKGKVDLVSRMYPNSEVNSPGQLRSSNPGPERAEPYAHAMAHRTGTRALDLKYDRPWWRRFIARDFG